MLRFLVVALLATACGRVVAQWSQPDELGQMLGIEEAVTDLEPSWATVTYGDEHTRSLLQYSPSTAPKIRVRYTSLMGIKTVQLDGTLFPTCASLTPSFVAGLKEGYVSAISDDLNTYDAVFASLSVTCFNTDGTSQPLRRRLNQVFPNQVLGIKFQLDADTPVGQETNVLAGITNSVQGGTVTSSTTYFCSCPFLILPLKYLNGDPPTCISSPPEVVTNCPPGQWDGGGDVEILLPNSRCRGAPSRPTPPSALASAPSPMPLRGSKAGPRPPMAASTRSSGCPTSAPTPPSPSRARPRTGSA